MFSSRTALLTVTALGLAATMAGCGGDDSDSNAATDRPTTPTKTEVAEKCQADVKLTGAVKATWKGKAVSSTRNTSGPAAFYKATHGALTLMVTTPAGEDLPPMAVLSKKGTTFTTQSEDGLDVAEDGTKATVDADAEPNGSGKAVHITADFSC